MKNKTLQTILIIFITGTLLLAMGLIAGVLLLRNSTNQPLINQASPTPVVEATPQPTGTATRAPEGTESAPTTGATAPTVASIPADIASQMDLIQQQVSSFRGLQLKEPFSRQLLTSEQLRQNVMNDFFKDYTPEDAAKDSKILSGFGLLRSGFDLQQFYIDLYSEQVAGYYDNTTQSMYVIADAAFGGIERSTYAHEFTHTLQDQNFDIENGLKVTDEHCKADTEYCAAVSALMEGDATLSEQFWLLRYSSAQDKQEILQFQQNYTSPVYDSAPAYMKQDFLFPYVQGFEFVNALYAKNKWQSVDDVYRNPPVSTEQILHPEKYPDDKPVPISLPDFTSSLDGGWSEVDRNVMGEWYISLILDAGYLPAARLDETTAQTAAAGWSGDTYVYYTDKDINEQVMVWQSLWDTDEDTSEFWDASLAYAGKRWGSAASSTGDSATWNTTDAGIVTMRKAGKNVLWMFTPDAETRDTILEKLGTFGN